jgi:tetratricopeptide (TPR) repeat protein
MTVSDAADADLSWLAGRHVALVGKLGGVSRRQAMQLLRELGGLPSEKCDATTQLIVIGAEEGRDAAATLLDDATQARLARGEAELLHETELWQRLGLVDSEHDVRRLYTPALLAELVGVSVSVIRRWHQRGLIEAAREVHRLPYFDFAEVAVARRLAELTAAGASTQAIERTVNELKRYAPHVARPLAELATVVEGKQLLLWRDDELIEPGGQRRFDFDEQKDEAQTSGVVLHPGSDAPLSAEQLLAYAGELEEEGRLSEAAESYRAALAAAGPTPETCFLLAELLYRQGDLSAARERYSMAIELDEDFVEARANLACVLAELGQLDLALAALAGALRFHPDYSDAHYHLARLLDEAGRPTEAVIHWQRFLELSPDSPWGEEARMRVGAED